MRDRKPWEMLKLFLAFAVAVGIGYGQPVSEPPKPPGIPPPPEILSIQGQEVIRISPEGDAGIERLLIVPPSPLTELYAGYWKAYGEQPDVRKNFVEELQKQYLILLGSRVAEPLIKPAPPEPALLAAQPFQVRVTATLPRLARYDPKEGIWHVAVGPQISEMVEAAVHARLSSLIFQSLYLESLPKEQQLEQRREVRFELPERARLLNGEELARLRWFVDFGGGTYLKGMVKVEDRVVILVEELIQTERPPANLLEEKMAPTAMDALAKFGVFTIKYSIPGVIPTPVPPAPPTGFVPPTNWSMDWGFSYSHTVSATLPHSPSGSTVTVSATPSLYFGAHLGWEFKPWWQGDGLKWFEAWIDINPSMSASLTATITQSLAWNKSVTLWTYSRDFYFCVLCFPVWIRLLIEASAHASVSAAARVGFSAQASAGATNRLGARWEGGWRKIVSRSPWASHPSFSVTTGANATTTAGPGLALAAYVYNVAGPFVQLTPYLKGEVRVSPRTWTLKAGFTASGGVQLAGWLQSFLTGLGSYSVDFYTWETTIGSGTW
ncbi:MAG: hypothetical protein NZ924_03450 [Candidatus Bipolaricaulota bacterium]|nr:hypothetical protein [Candidatus Bipolaricaulota bacterium]MDW8151963.1 hypothetical protein [Candidatus Bipolaricaulota bacterium]